MRNPLGPLPPMGPGVHLPDDEWQHWTSYFSKLFPTAGEAWVNNMVIRMIKTLGYDGKPVTMSTFGYLQRLKIFQKSLNDLPPDPHNLLMPGDA